VNIKSQSAALNVNISGSSITLNVSVTSPLDTSGNLKVSVQSSVTINVNISGQSITLNVNINSVTAGLNLPIDIKAQSVTLNVNIVGSTATLNINIASQSITVNINIAGYPATLTPATLLEKGGRVSRKGSVSGGSSSIYTVPTGKTAYILVLSWEAYNTSTTIDGDAEIYYVSGTTSYTIKYIPLPAGRYTAGEWSSGVIKLNAGETLYIYAYTGCVLSVSAIIMEV